MTLEPEFCRLIHVSKLAHGTDRVFEISATEDECLALAKRLNLLVLKSLVASISLSLRSRGKLVRLRGHFSADVVQSCVVSLEPVFSHIEEDFTLSYAEAEETAGDLVEVDICLEANDPPEPLLSGNIDIGEAVAEHLALALDPFPRLEGVVFGSIEIGDDTIISEKTSPFSALSSFLFDNDTSLGRKIPPPPPFFKGGRASKKGKIPPFGKGG